MGGDRERDSGSDERAAEPSGEQVLAALVRAELHGERPASAVALWTLLEHLDTARRSHTARRVRALLDELEAAGLATRHTRHGVPVWRATRAGGARARRLSPALPESPQHRAWRESRALARREHGRFRRELAAALADARTLLDEEPDGASRPESGGDRVRGDDWLLLAHRLRLACRRLGSATHILGEWDEPGDDRADVDTLSCPGDDALGAGELARRRAMRRGRRNPRLWQEP